MTAQQTDLVRETWRNLLPIRETVGDLFYKRLLVMAPKVRALFAHDLEPQAQKLMALCTTVVANLDNTDAFIPQIKALAVRYKRYGARPEHYAAIGQALLWALEKGLGDQWTPATRNAWTIGYTLLSELMMEAQWTAATMEL
jgi:hemoglobin-like flavoprotein